jgi:hypothetical protein
MEGFGNLDICPLTCQLTCDVIKNNNPVEALEFDSISFDLKDSFFQSHTQPEVQMIASQLSSSCNSLRYLRPINSKQRFYLEYFNWLSQNPGSSYSEFLKSIDH